VAKELKAAERANKQLQKELDRKGKALAETATLLETLYKLGVTPSNSRPRVSNDNAYSESIFKTLKYRPNYQQKVSQHSRKREHGTYRSLVSP